MDGDDISLPTRFEKEVKFLDEHPEYAIVSAPMIYFDEKGEFGRGQSKGGEPIKENIIYGSPFCHAPCMVRTEAYKKVGGYTVDKRLLRYEDYNLWTKMYVAGYRGYNLEEHLYAMRDDPTAYKRRTFKSRLNGVYAHYLAYRALHLSFYGFIKYSISILVAGLVPKFIYDYYHKNRFR